MVFYYCSLNSYKSDKLQVLVNNFLSANEHIEIARCSEEHPATTVKYLILVANKLYKIDAVLKSRVAKGLVTLVYTEDSPRSGIFGCQFDVVQSWDTYNTLKDGYIYKQLQDFHNEELTKHIRLRAMCPELPEVTPLELEQWLEEFLADYLVPYDISIGQTLVPFLKNNVYVLQDKAVLRETMYEKGDTFVHNEERIGWAYKTTLNDYLSAYLQVKTYMELGLAPYKCIHSEYKDGYIIDREVSIKDRQRDDIHVWLFTTL